MKSKWSYLCQVVTGQIKSARHEGRAPLNLCLTRRISAEATVFSEDTLSGPLPITQSLPPRYSCWGSLHKRSVFQEHLCNTPHFETSPSCSILRKEVGIYPLQCHSRVNSVSLQSLFYSCSAFCSFCCCLRERRKKKTKKHLTM